MLDTRSFFKGPGIGVRHHKSCFVERAADFRNNRSAAAANADHPYLCFKKRRRQKTFLRRGGFCCRLLASIFFYRNLFRKASGRVSFLNFYRRFFLCDWRFLFCRFLQNNFFSRFFFTEKFLWLFCQFLGRFFYDDFFYRSLFLCHDVLPWIAKCSMKGEFQVFSPNFKCKCAIIMFRRPTSRGTLDVSSNIILSHFHSRSEEHTSELQSH